MESSHQIFCAFVAEASDAGVDEKDGFEAPVFNGTAPNTANLKLCGYMNAPQSDRGLNNSLGYNIGSPNASYYKRGTRNPTLSITLRGGGALELLEYANRLSTGRLPRLCFYVGVPGAWTDVYRLCKIGNLNLQAKEASKGEAAEIEVTLQIEATALIPLSGGDILNPTLSSLLADLKVPLFWHDVRTFTIERPDGVSGNPFKMRRAVSSFSVQINHNLERKNERNYFGDNAPLSNTSYDLLEHNINVSGEIGLHERLSEELLTATAKAQTWGDIEIVIGDIDKAQEIVLTLEDAFPQNYTSEGVEAGAQLSHSVPYLAKKFSLKAGVPVVTPTP